MERLKLLKLKVGAQACTFLTDDGGLREARRQYIRRCAAQTRRPSAFSSATAVVDSYSKNAVEVGVQVHPTLLPANVFALASSLLVNQQRSACCTLKVQKVRPHTCRHTQVGVVDYVAPSCFV